MTIFSANELSKSYNGKALFSNIAFGMEKGDRVGIIGKNGIGKTTLMKIVAGLVEADSGSVVFNNQVRSVYLDQLPDFSTNETAIEYVLGANTELYGLLEQHKELCRSNNSSAQLTEISNKIDQSDG
jgi:ATP-binding cassette subfamily F protein uup